ncbi:hypothetical protein [Brevibacillus sp. NRS-1366]|uniref:hypothetical protein n=1 Tax=Brevibacillus sp. NRS-1366 TaxID=3233899 RepID=UPI003D1EBEEF
MSRIEEIKKRIEQLQELEDALMTAGNAQADKIIREQAAIQEYYYADVSDLLEELESLQKYCDKWKTWFHEPIERNEDIV